MTLRTLGRALKALPFAASLLASSFAAAQDNDTSSQPVPDAQVSPKTAPLSAQIAGGDAQTGQTAKSQLGAGASTERSLSIGEGQSLGALSLPDVPVLTIEADRIFAQTKFGQSLSRELEQSGAQIAGENRRIEAELAEEESLLTAKRPDTPADEFRKLADAFDERVRKLRSEQDEKVRLLTRRTDVAQRAFLRAIVPILEELMIEKGASVILDRRAVFLSADASDITDMAIARINDRFGDGTSLRDLLPAPAQVETEDDQ